MKASPYLSFVEEEEEEFERNSSSSKALPDFSCSTTNSLLLHNNNTNTNLNWNLQGSICSSKGGELIFHVDTTRSPSPSPVAASSTISTLSSSLNSGGAGGGGGCSTATTQDIADPKSSCEWGNAALPAAESVASPGQEQSILRLIMGDIEEDPSAGLTKLLQGSSLPAGMDFGGGFSLMDHHHHIQGGLSFDNNNSSRQVNPFSSFSDSGASSVNVMSSFVPPPLQPPSIQQQNQMIMNHNQTQFLQNPSFFGFNDGPLSPPPKRINLGSNYQQQLPSSAVVMKQQQQQQHYQQQNADGQQQAIIDQLYKTVELIETGNAVLAQEILARLNHHLSPIGKPFYKAAFYFKEALNSSILLNTAPQPPPFSPFSVIYKIGAYKSFCEISPIVQFANFTSNQAFLEAFQGCNRVHILSFDVGFGGEWASLMQELALRNGGPPSLKITAFAAPSPSAATDDLELGLTEENLKHFAWELNISLEFEVVNINCFSSPNFQLPQMNSSEEAIAVNLPIGAFANYPSYLPRALRFLKQLSPKIVVCLDRGGCDRIDTPFPNHMIHALQSYTTLIESLEAVNSNSDALHKIERYLIQPGIEKIVSGRRSSSEKTMGVTLVAWRSLFVSSGFTPLTFSNFNESQAECLVQRNLVRGFHVEKRQSSLVLCWNRKELISASAWTTSPSS